ncbi:MAG: ABC transporter ATP-binding protein [Bacteroidaceae bacterium]|nr:ABC transporter ATP-binding protein [Bacteroidaceae bacterium]
MNPATTLQTLRWFVRTSRGIRLRSIANTLTGVIGVGLDFAFIWATKRCIDTATHQTEGSLTESALLLGAVMASIIALGFARNWLAAILGVQSTNKIQRRMFETVLGSVWLGRDRQHTGDTMNRLDRDVRDVTSVISNTLPQALIVTCRLIGAFVFLCVYDARLACALMVITPLFIALSKFYVRRMRALTRDIRKTDSEIQSIMQESLQHRIMLKTMEQEDGVVERLGLTQQSLSDQIRYRTRFSSVSNALVNIGFAGGYLVAFLWGAWRLEQGLITYGMMLAFIQLVGQIQGPFRDMTRFIPTLISSLTAGERLMELEQLPQEETCEAIRFKGGCGIRLKDLSYAYDEDYRLIIDRLSYDFPPGSITAVLGETGSGKTTLIRLILALLPPLKGRVEFYDGDVSTKASPGTRCNLVYVPQGNSLLSGTVRSNLQLGRPDSTDSEMWDALELAEAGFVKESDEGLDMPVGESGLGLSEGQAQRIAIARALLRPGRVLLLDEATSALDEETETRVLDNLMGRNADSPTPYTVICVTHRPAVTAHCNQMLRLKRL